MKFFFVTAVLMTWIVIQLYNSIYCRIFGPVQKLQKHRLFSSFSSFFLLTSLWFANKILMIHGFDIAVCMCDEFSTPTIKSLPSLVFVFCRHWQIFLFVFYIRRKTVCVWDENILSLSFFWSYHSVCECLSVFSNRRWFQFISTKTIQFYFLSATFT